MFHCLCWCPRSTSWYIFNLSVYVACKMAPRWMTLWALFILYVCLSGEILEFKYDTFQLILSIITFLVVNRLSRLNEVTRVILLFSNLFYLLESTERLLAFVADMRRKSNYLLNDRLLYSSTICRAQSINSCSLTTWLSDWYRNTTWTSHRNDRTFKSAVYDEKL